MRFLKHLKKLYAKWWWNTFATPGLMHELTKKEFEKNMLKYSETLKKRIEIINYINILLTKIILN